MKKLLSIGILAASTALTAPAFAADPPQTYGHDYHWYLELRAGGAIPHDHDFVTGAVTAGTYEPDGGFHGAISIGRYISENWRAELDFSITNANDGAATTGMGVIPHTGDIDVYTFMIAALYDFHTNSSWTPFVGVGIGFAHIDFDNLTGGAFATTGDDTVLAAALKAGVSVPLSEMLDFTARYELAIIGGGDYATTIPGVNTSTDTEVEHLFSAGIRINFR